MVVSWTLLLLSFPIGRMLTISGTRLGDFLMFLAAGFLTKVAQIYGDFVIS